MMLALLWFACAYNIASGTYNLYCERKIIKKLQQCQENLDETIRLKQEGEQLLIDIKDEITRQLSIV